MSISKKRAIKLIDEKIDQFNYLLDQFNDDKINRKEYKNIYYGAESLIEALFSKNKKDDFRNNASIGIIPHGAGQIEIDKIYKKHLNDCISQLNAYKTTVQNFWEKDKLINWNTLKVKLQTIWTWVKKSWLLILGILSFIVVVAGAITGWPIITEFINSTLT